LAALDKPLEPIEHFDAVLALCSIALAEPDLTPTVMAAVACWASRSSLQGGGTAAFRKQTLESARVLFSSPGGAQGWRTAWCERWLAAESGSTTEAVRTTAAAAGVPQHELVALGALNDVGDCGRFVDGLAPAILLLPLAINRGAAAFYEPASILPLV